VPALAPILQWLPALVFIWMVVGAGLLFTRDVGQRDARGLGIALSIWGTLGAKSVAITPPLSVQLIGAGGLLLSLALYQWAAISIRGRLFSYAGNNDLPQFVHRSGPYAYVRNPFYLSYLLAEIATVVMWPTIWGGVIVVLATVYFQWLAWFEEGKFARSTVAVEYAQYKARTGRLLPRLKRRGLH
jgi:protein-S-isoprenylcysteine O-methyltransferase Ste14